MHHGGLDHAVMFIDLDCRFDILHFSRLLENQITIAEGMLSIPFVVAFMPHYIVASYFQSCLLAI